MDIETQLQFINSEIAECDARKAKLEAIKLSLTDASSIQVGSIDSLQKTLILKDAEIVRLSTENAALKVAPVVNEEPIVV